jgi:hypothetical protein
MIDRTAIRLSAVLVAAGFIFYVVVGLLHAGRPANNHPVVFAIYASSASWTAVHLGQFVGMAVIIAGLLVLYFALDIRAGAAAWVARLGAVSAAVALALYGVLQAVDGVALKQAVDAWVRAPEAEKAARFASAETIRWLEWGTRSYQSFMFGLTLILLGSAVALTARLPRAIGYLIGAVRSWLHRAGLGARFRGLLRNRRIRNPGRLRPHGGLDHLACCGRLADEGIVQNAHSVATDPQSASISSVAGHRSSSDCGHYVVTTPSSPLSSRMA